MSLRNFIIHCIKYLYGADNLAWNCDSAFISYCAGFWALRPTWRNDNFDERQIWQNVNSEQHRILCDDYFRAVPFVGVALNLCAMWYRITLRCAARQIVHTFILIFLRFLSLFTPADQWELICLNRAQQHVAATKIQALWRGWHIRHLIDVNTTKVSSLFYWWYSK